MPQPKIYKKLNVLLKAIVVYIVPVALILNWLLNPSWRVVLSNCVDFSGEKMISGASGFPFISCVATYGEACMGADFRTASYFWMTINGLILLLISLLIYHFLSKKIKFNLWQSIVSCFILYGTFGMYFIASMDFIQCGTFGYDKILGIDHFWFNKYGLLKGIDDIFYYGGYYLLLLPILIAILIFLQHRKTHNNSSLWWVLIYSYWSIFLFVVLISEGFLARYDDQIITSSGDITYRQHWLSILLGYSLILASIHLSRKLIMQQKKFFLLSAFGLTFISSLIFIQNQHCIVIGTNGNRIVEFYTPFYEYEKIGCLMYDYENPMEKLNGEYENKNILSIKTEGNKIVFKRPIVGDYKITKQFLFWRFDFPYGEINY